MTEINFYHLSISPIEKALPKLLEKIYYNIKLPIVVRAVSEEIVESLNAILWSFSSRIFLPHGSKNDPFPNMQPIFLTAQEENPNNAEILVAVGGAIPENISNYKKYLYMFDGASEEEVTKARAYWKKYKEQGHNINYFQQNINGSWE